MPKPPTKAEMHEAIQSLVKMTGTEYVSWRMRLRHAMTRRAWSDYGFVQGLADFQPWPRFYDALEAKHGKAIAEERLDTMLFGVTMERRRLYMKHRRHTEQVSPEMKARRRRHAKEYMRKYREQQRLKEAAAEKAATKRKK